MEELGNKMKKYESDAEQIGPENSIMLARIDGNCFSSWTRAFKTRDQYYCKEIGNAMVETAGLLLKEFKATLAYVQSDEITLVWVENRPRNGRIQKTASLLSGFASSHFNSLIKHPYGRIPYFDARVFFVPDVETARSNIVWRIRDCIRNSTSILASFALGKKNIHGMSSVEQRQAASEKGLEWRNAPGHFKHGTILVKERYEKVTVNPKTNKEVTAIRHRIVNLDAGPEQEERITELLLPTK